VKLGKSRQPGLLSHVPAYVDLCLSIVRVIALPGIEVGYCWGCVVGDVPVKPVGEHFSGDVVVEFLDLLPNVMQEGVAGPAANHHDKENWKTPKEHHHSCSRTNGVHANLIGCNVEGVLPNCQDGISQHVCDVLGCNVFDAVVLPDG
jgi:hypothetical protein